MKGPTSGQNRAIPPYPREMLPLLASCGSRLRNLTKSLVAPVLIRVRRENRECSFPYDEAINLFVLLLNSRWVKVGSQIAQKFRFVRLCVRVD
jgi:hypothetical protein